MLLLVIFSSVFVNAGVTNIKEVVNNTSEKVTVSKGTVREKRNEYATVIETFFSMKETTDAILNGGTWSGDIWIPWVDNVRDFKNNVILIYIEDEFGRFPHRNKSFLLWQTGDAVRLVSPFSNKLYEFVRNAPKISGEAKVNGERRLVVGKENDQYVITLEKF